MSNTNNSTDTESFYKSYSQMSDSERKEFQRTAFSAINKMAMQDVSKISRSSSFLARFKVEEIARWIQNPAQFEKQLRQLS